MQPMMKSYDFAYVQHCLFAFLCLSTLLHWKTHMFSIFSIFCWFGSADKCWSPIHLGLVTLSNFKTTYKCWKCWKCCINKWWNTLKSMQPMMKSCDFTYFGSVCLHFCVFCYFCIGKLTFSTFSAFCVDLGVADRCWSHRPL